MSDRKSSKQKSIILFEEAPVRRVWLEKEGKWYFSVVDVIRILTDSVNPTDYLKKLRKRDEELGYYIGTNCSHVEMATETGKKRKTLAGNTEQLFRVIQSIPSPKAEPFKRWLAKVGYERMQEISDPEKALNRSREYWQKMGRSEKWIQFWAHTQFGWNNWTVIAISPLTVSIIPRFILFSSYGL